MVCIDVASDRTLSTRRKLCLTSDEGRCVGLANGRAQTWSDLARRQPAGAFWWDHAWLGWASEYWIGTTCILTYWLSGRLQAYTSFFPPYILSAVIYVFLAYIDSSYIAMGDHLVLWTRTRRLSELSTFQMWGGWDLLCLIYNTFPKKQALEICVSFRW